MSCETLVVLLYSNDNVKDKRMEVMKEGRMKERERDKSRNKQERKQEKKERKKEEKKKERKKVKPRSTTQFNSFS